MRNRRLVAPILCLALALLAASRPAAAEVELADFDSGADSLITGPAATPPNLYVNPTFAQNVAGWTLVPTAGTQVDWSTADVDGDPRSGSARITHVLSQANGVGIGQCFPVTPGHTYSVGGKGWMAPGGPSGSSMSAVYVVYPSPGCTGSSDTAGFGRSFAVGAWSPLGTTFKAAASAASVRVSFAGFKTIATATPLVVYVDNLYFRDGGCVTTDTQLCLAGGRFLVQTGWKASDGQTGLAHTVPFTADSGSFWFFGPGNIELNVKVLDACSFNGKYWVFAAAATDVEVTLTVTDTKTGAAKTYKNPLGHPFTTITDTSAFATCP